MAKKFRMNGTTYTLLHLSSRVTTPSYCYRQGGMTYYTPLLTSRSQSIGSYVYDASYPTICVRLNNTTYYAAKSRTENYDIPEGTYTPSAFKSLIEAFMSLGSKRTCNNSFTVKINKVTTTISAGSVIYYSFFSSGSTARLIGFGYNPSSYYYHVQVNRSETTIYCVSRDTVTDNNTFYEGYERYPITIGTGIKFN